MRKSRLSPQEQRRIVVFRAAREIISPLLSDGEVAASAAKYMPRKICEASDISAWATSAPCPVEVFNDLLHILDGALAKKQTKLDAVRARLWNGALEKADPMNPFKKKSRRVE